MDLANYHNEFVAGVHPTAPPQHRSLENPALPLNDPAIWEEVFGTSYRAETGESITAQKALMYAPFYRAVQLISGDVAKLPRRVYKRRSDLGEDARERDRGHRLNYVLNVAANEYQEAIKFWERFVSDALIYRNAYARIMYDGSGAPTELYNLLPDRTCREWIDGQMWYMTEVGGRIQALFPWEVLHIEGPVLCAEAQPLFQLAKNSIALGLAQEKFASKFFRNGGRVGGILELPSSMGKGARDTLEEGFRKAYEGTDNPFKTVILRDNAKFHSAQQSPRDSQMVEATEGQTRQIAHWFNLPPSKLGLSDSVSYNSKSEDNQNYLDTTLQIWLTRIESACNFRLISERQSETHFIEHNTSSLLRMNLLAQAQAFQILVGSRVMNPNECRAKLNMLPYEGGDAFVNPNTMTSGDDTQDDEEPDADEEPEDEPTEDQPPERSTDYKRMVFEITKRGRFKAGKSIKTFSDWIDENMKDHRANYKGSEPFPFDKVTEHFRDKFTAWRTKPVTQKPLPLAVDEWCIELEARA